MSLASKVENLKIRAAKLQEVRNFFSQRRVMEVDCLALHTHPTIDGYIDPIELEPIPGETYYLHTSPEYKMKRLLCNGIGDIYQISHVFRSGEKSARHSPEFTMVEWYRTHKSLEDLISETIEFTEMFTGPKKHVYYQFYEALEKFGQIHSLSKESLIKALEKHHLSFDPSWTLQQLLHLTWGEVIEKKFDKDQITIVTHFPDFEAALAKIDSATNPQVARRFEIYHGGYELGNGYDELQDPEEHILRFTESNEMRALEGKKTYEIDPDLIEALKKGLPDCSGIALGFDRLMMLHLKTMNIHDVIF